MHYLRHLCFVGDLNGAKEVLAETTEMGDPISHYLGKAIYDFFRGDLLRALYSSVKAVLFSDEVHCYVGKMVFAYAFLSGVECGEYGEVLKRARGLVSRNDLTEREEALYEVAKGILSALGGERVPLKTLRRLFHRYEPFSEEEWKLIGLWEMRLLFPESFEEYARGLREQFESRGLRGGLEVFARLYARLQNLKLILRGDGE
jgi:hypothetical protein